MDRVQSVEIGRLEKRGSIVSYRTFSAKERPQDAPGTRSKGLVGEGRQSTYSISDALEPFHSLWNGALIHFLSGNGFAELLHNRMVRLQRIEG